MISILTAAALAAIVGTLAFLFGRSTGRAEAQAAKDAFAAAAGTALERNAAHFLELAESKLKNLQVQSQAELEARKTAVESLVTPLAKSLTELDHKIADIEVKRARAYAEVATKISELGDVSKELRAQTGTLVQSLRSSNVRGNWGQIQLRRVVELAGMVDHCDFTEQQTVESDAGNLLRPDLVVKLPGGRSVVVDAKTPKIFEGLDAKTDDEKAQYLKAQADTIRRHMTQLASKRYQDQFTPHPEFVIMFLPVEAVFAAALQQDPELLEFGASRKVIPASPLTLIALLQAVNYGWKEASLARDARDVQELGKKLYESVRILSDHMLRMRNHLEGAVVAFNSSVGSLERNFLTQARKFKDLNSAGASEIEEMRPIDERLRALEAPELRQGTLDVDVMEAVILAKPESKT